MGNGNHSYPVASVLGSVLTVVFGVSSAKEAFAPFGDPIIMFFLGGFFLAQAMSVHNLDQRFAVMILSHRSVTRHPYLLVLAFSGIVMFISMWISNTATTAMMFPITLGTIRALVQVQREASDYSDENFISPFAIGMFLIAAYMSSIGGIGTPIGSPTNLVGIGMLDKLAGIRISFLTWMGLTIPVMLGIFLLSYLYLIRVCPHHRICALSAKPFSLNGKSR